MKTNLPVIVLRGIIMLPYAELKIDLIDEVDMKIIDLSNDNHDGYVLLSSPENYLEESLNIKDLPSLGVVGKIVKRIVLPNGSVRICVEGIKRATVNKYMPYEGVNNVFASEISSPTRYAIDARDEAALVRKLKTELEKYISLVPYASNSILAVTQQINSVSKLSDVISNYLPLTFERKYEYLKMVNPHARVMMNLEDIQKELDIYEIESKIDANLKMGLDKSQKEFILREKIKLIKEELGDISSKDDDVEVLTNQIKKLKAPLNIIKKLEKELKKYESTPSASPEISIIRNYLDVMISLPWNTYTKDNTNLSQVMDILNSSHYGLNEIKERIIEYLAVKKMSVSNKTPIICLVGPPGVGKTSLAKSIAKSMNRKFAKISVGGVNDPAEIIGHRRTYMGASAGRIITAIKKSGSNNPVFLIDEIDKMTKDIKGDPASSLLEVLDYEQNDKFYDNYIEEAYDLSKVMFILTANYIEQIPEELKDRLEIVNLSSYTEYEKLHIAKDYLLKNGLKEYNLTDKNIKFSDEVIFTIIKNYTKEAGVRDLDRNINKIIRMFIKQNMERGKSVINIKVTLKDIEVFLGKPKYTSVSLLPEAECGTFNALAYTNFGGEALPLEVVIYPGKQAVILTGNLGKVMSESAEIAMGYIKSHAKKLNVNLEKLKDMTIHINALEGAVAKEGPSAGVALTTAIISALTHTSISNKYASTGEITLSGKVLQIGGLKEKLIGAYRSGVKQVFIPKANERDLDDVPKEVLKNIEVSLIDSYEQMYEILFQKKEK